MWLGSAREPGARAGGPGSCRLAMAMAGGPSSATGLARCLAYHWSPGLDASCLKQEGSAEVEAEPGIIRTWAGLWANG